MSRNGTADAMQKALQRYGPALAFHLPFDEVPDFPFLEHEAQQDRSIEGDAFDMLMRELEQRAKEIRHADMGASLAAPGVGGSD